MIPLPGIKACDQTKIEHHLIRPRCPWTNGQVEQMNRTIKDATVKQHHYASQTNCGCNYSCSWMRITMDAA